MRLLKTGNPKPETVGFTTLPPVDGSPGFCDSSRRQRRFCVQWM